MARLHVPKSSAWFLSNLLIILCLLCFGHAQILNQDTELEAHDLPFLMARTPHASDVLLTSLDTVIHDRDICCGRDSALEDSSQAADPGSLKDVATKLDGRHLLGDGRPIQVTAEYFSPDTLNSGYLLAMIKSQHPPIMQWNSHLYVVHGIVYLWVEYGSSDSPGPTEVVIHKFLLWDTRYSDSRREVVFNRDTDDMSKVQGFLFVQAKLQ